MTKIYTTKYCLIDGIQEFDAEICSAISQNMARVKSGQDAGISQYLHKNEWFETRDEAVQNANLRVANEIKRVEKKLAKLREMKFR